MKEVALARGALRTAFAGAGLAHLRDGATRGGQMFSDLCCQVFHGTDLPARSRPIYMIAYTYHSGKSRGFCAFSINFVMGGIDDPRGRTQGDPGPKPAGPPIQ